jgi:hypothetical protein
LSIKGQLSSFFKDKDIKYSLNERERDEGEAQKVRHMVTASRIFGDNARVEDKI